jgi:hypothetical protein
MAKAVPVHVKMAEKPVNAAYLQKSLQHLHTLVILGMIENQHFSEQQRAFLLMTMQKKLPEKKSQVSKTA